MEFETKYITPHIKLARYEGKRFKTEVVFEHHMLVWFISGETKIVLADATHIFNAGDIFLIPRNKIATIINYPTDLKPHQSVVMHFTEERLKAYYKKYLPIKSAAPFEKVRVFNSHPLLKSCLASLIPYFELTEDLPEVIASIKIEEAINILRAIDKDIDPLLANFEEPGKISLLDFMEKHFMFNMPLAQFSQLTGRSLATFRRDFMKTFKQTPQKWLTQKRLKLAHYQITEKQCRPSSVYLETGFENFSHFSYAFKKHFGYAPRDVH